MRIVLIICTASILGTLSTTAEAMHVRKARPAPPPSIATDFSASHRQHHVRNRHAGPTTRARATRVYVHRDSYSWFIPYAPPVPHFYPYGYHLGYF